MSEIEIPQPKNQNPESALIRTRSSLDGTVKSVNRTGTAKKDNLKGGLKKKEPSFKQKLKRSFVKDDLKDLRDYLIFDMIIPNARQLLFNTIVGTTAQIFGFNVPRNGMLWQYTNYSNGYNPRNTTPHERQFRDYNSIEAARAADRRNRQHITPYDRFYVSDFVFDYKEDAESTVEQMMDICDTNGWVSVATFFEIADPRGEITNRDNYTNNNFGWYSMESVTIRNLGIGEGYVIELPPAKPRYR